MNNPLRNLSSFLIVLSILFYVGCASNDTPKPADCSNSNLAIELVNKTNPTDCSTNNGSIEVSATGGQSPYQYAIGTGSFSSAAVFSNLGGGSFTLTVKDKNGCTKSLDVSLTTPAGPVATTPVIENDTECLAPYNGSISIGATGGTGPYQFKLDNGSFGASSTFTGVKGGAHTITIKDAANCSITVNVNVPKGSTGITYTADILPIFQAKCQNGSCHPANGDWFTYDIAKSKKDAIKTRTGNKTMPAGGGSLTDDQIALIACWVDGGAPQ